MFDASKIRDEVKEYTGVYFDDYDVDGILNFMYVIGYNSVDEIPGDEWSEILETFDLAQ